MSESDGLSDAIRAGLDEDTARTVLKLVMQSFTLRGDIKNLCAQGKKTGREKRALQREVDQLKAENESLRKQLEARHPFKPALDEITIGYTGCLICGKYTDHGGLQCTKMRAYAISSPENP